MPNMIRAARAGLGWTQEELAELAGVHHKSVALAEQEGRRRTRQTPNAVEPKIWAAFAQHGVKLEASTLTFPQPPSP